MIDAAHDDLCHAADPCVFRDLHRRSRPVHHGNLRPLLLRQVQIAAQLLYIPCGKEILQDLLVWRFRQTFPTRRSLSTSRCLVCRHPWVLLCAASSTRTVGIWSISTLPELSAAVFVFLIQQDLPSVQQGQCIRSYMRLHIAHHQISALFLRLMRRLRQGIRFAHAAA